MVAPNGTKLGFSDPHPNWLAERQSIWWRLELMMELGQDEQLADYDEQRKALDDADEGLLIKIQTKPALTIEGALVQIEAHDIGEAYLGLQHQPEHETHAIRARVMATATIRRCLAEAGR